MQRFSLVECRIGTAVVYINIQADRHRLPHKSRACGSERGFLLLLPLRSVFPTILLVMIAS